MQGCFIYIFVLLQNFILSYQVHHILILFLFSILRLPMHTPQVPRIQRAGSDMDASRVRRVKQAKPTNLPNWGENLPKDVSDYYYEYSHLF